MSSSLFEPSLREQQIAMSLLAHVARHDREAIVASLTMMGDKNESARLIAVVASLLHQFDLGMRDDDGPALAEWFSSRAQALAAAREPAK